MGDMTKLKKMLCAELDEIGEKGELSSGDVQTLSMLAGAYKNVLKIEELEGGESYGHYVRGHYSRADGNSYRGENSYRGGSYRGGSYRAGGYAGAEDGMQAMEDSIQQLAMRGKLNREEEDMLRKAMQMMDR